jgi:hypothetical protein
VRRITVLNPAIYAAHIALAQGLKELLERGILTKDPGGGRSTSYHLAEPDEVR